MLVNQACGYIKEKNGNKYLIFVDYVNENKELLIKYTDFWDGIKNEIKTINGGKVMVTEKITWKLNLILKMTCYWTNH